METIEEYLASIDGEAEQKKFSELYEWSIATFPQLELRFGWSQPMFTHHGTFIITFKKTKKHITVSPEVAGIKQFEAKIEAAGYAHTGNTFRIGWEQATDYRLLEEMIQFNLDEKAEYTAFWRKAKK